MERLLDLIEKSKDYNVPVCRKFEDDDVNEAMTMFKRIKAFEKAGESEYFAAVEDLKVIFGYEKKELCKMTKNQLYNVHCTKMVNRIVAYLRML